MKMRTCRYRLFIDITLLGYRTRFSDAPSQETYVSMYIIKELRAVTHFEDLFC